MCCSKSCGDRGATSSTRYIWPAPFRPPNNNSGQRLHDEQTNIALHSRGRVAVQRGPRCVRGGEHGRGAVLFDFYKRQEEEKNRLVKKIQSKIASGSHARSHQGNSGGPPEGRILRGRTNREVGRRNRRRNEKVSG